MKFKHALTNTSSILLKNTCILQTMTTAERVWELMLARGVKPRQIRGVLASTCDITYSAVAQWFDSQTKKISPEYLVKISPEYLVKIATKYGTTVEWLVSGKGTRDVSTAQLVTSQRPLSSKEQAFIEVFHQLDADDLEDILAMVEAKLTRKNKDPTTIKLLRGGMENPVAKVKTS